MVELGRVLSSSATIAGEVHRSIITARSHEHYYQVFGYLPINLRGKTILDIGSGGSNFAGEAYRDGAKVVSLDACYNFYPPEDDTKDPVCGVAQYLPFGNGKFDEVVASFSLYWVKSGLSDALKEMVRVTKQGGKVKIFPATLKDHSDRSRLPDFVSFNREGALVIKKNIGLCEKDWKLVATFLARTINFQKCSPISKIDSVINDLRNRIVNGCLARSDDKQQNY